MCGIVAYIGEKQAYSVLVKGLKRLEYRGYDSAGIALLNGKINVYKTKGKVSDLEHLSKNQNIFGNVGIGHTRWATHGEPNSVNAHPHLTEDKHLAIVHNGIIENYATLKEELEARGHLFESETDTEVLLHLIEDVLQKEKVSVEDAVRIALNQVAGAYAIVLLDKTNPDQLICARKGSPMVLGIAPDGFYIASDATPIVEYTKQVVYLDDKEIAVVKREGEFFIKTMKNEQVTPYVQQLQIQLEALEKGGYEHFMLKEIFEQPQSIIDSIRGRLILDKDMVMLGGVSEYEERFVQAKRIIIIACGTSWHAGLIGEYLLEELARIPVEVEYASEFRYRNPVIHEGDIIIAISQSGETADTLAAIEMAKEKGALVYGICNVVGASIPRNTHAGSYTHAGPEIGVASTKAFTTQVTLLVLMALQVAKKKGTISNTFFHQIANELEQIPQKIRQVLDTNASEIERIAETYKEATNFLYLGRGYNFPVALEGALKLKEISYIHAEGYPAAEMKHGPIALIDEHMPVVVLANNKSAYSKLVSNIQEVLARKGKVIAIVDEHDREISKMATHSICVPSTVEPLSPFLSTIPLQLLSYHIAVKRGCNVDQPRNLAKSVTVE